MGLITSFTNSRKTVSRIGKTIDYRNQKSAASLLPDKLPAFKSNIILENGVERSEIRKFFLIEGHIMIITIPSDIITVLGSCVSVCLWDKRRKIGGMSHFLLPGNATEETRNFSRGTSATGSLIKSILNRKCNRQDLEAKIFGGANMNKSTSELNNEIERG